MSEQPNKYDSIERLTFDDELCEVCGVVISTMTFRGTGVCGDNHMKVRNGEAAVTDRAITP